MKLQNALIAMAFLSFSMSLSGLPARASMQEGVCPGRMQAGQWSKGSLQTLEGRIKDVSLDPACMGRGSRLSLQVTVDGKDYLVHLGPVSYVNSKKLGIALGETVRIKGLPIGDPSEAVFIAAEVEIKGHTLKLRDENGRPVWAGHPKGGVS